VQEEHGGRRRLLRVRYRLRTTGYTRLLGLAALLVGATSVFWQNGFAAAGAALLLAAWLGVWWRGTRRAAVAVTVVDAKARELGLLCCGGPRSRRPDTRAD
jgi:hypothetical protein